MPKRRWDSRKNNLLRGDPGSPSMQYWMMDRDPAPHHHTEGRIIMTSRTIKTITKLGMVGSLAVLVLPRLHQAGHGKRHGRSGSSDVHVWAGIALLGFAVWHYNCYQPPAGTTKRGYPV